jgi:probable 2-oxoglutarate dehydrogenase E1 component DHKTD1
MLVNQQTEGVIVPLNDELKAPGKLELANSLSIHI